MGRDEGARVSTSGVDRLEEEAAETLQLFEGQEDPVLAGFRDAPEDDEPWTEADEAAAQEAEEDPAPSIPLEQIKHEFGIE